MFAKFFSKSKDTNNKLLKKVDNMALYHYGGCPYCFRVRIAMTKLNLDIPMNDILKSQSHRKELKSGGGSTTVPCLRIEEEGKIRWMYESEDIVEYLEREFGKS